MVVKLTGRLCSIYSICVCLVCISCLSCENDFLGAIASTSLEERLKSANSFPYFDNASPPKPPDSGADFSFLFLSDIHIAVDLKTKLNELPIQPSDKFVVLCGDITQSGEYSEIQKCIDITKSWPIPCYLVIGNHDIYFGNWANWKELIGSTRYATESNDGNTKLIFLDSANGTFGAAQLDWLQHELQSAPANTFVFSHNNLWATANPFAPDYAGFPNLQERARFISILSNSNAKAYLSGHLHKEIVQQVKGCKYICLDNFEKTGDYLRVTVHADGTISYQFNSLIAL
ncbi:MAG: metallophosphoesterase [Spirochaetaceae bacterium]|jgi:3',5'-cyclic AMP phosphodiesterase CpdA|nr:metallophosphoesterase [Spirochaetaceae bacterium]